MPPTLNLKFRKLDFTRIVYINGKSCFLPYSLFNGSSKKESIISFSNILEIIRELQIAPLKFDI